VPEFYIWENMPVYAGFGVREAAKLLGAPPKRILELVAKHRLPTVRLQKEEWVSSGRMRRPGRSSPQRVGSISTQKTLLLPETLRELARLLDVSDAVVRQTIVRAQREAAFSSELSGRPAALNTD
jgi:hypothetical protein